MERELFVVCGQILMLTVWVSLPLLPAILIYRLFPDTAVAVSGPLAKLTFKATGAFGAYLIVFFTIIPIVNPMFNILGNVSHHPGPSQVSST
jgi:hypothetical protein